jgi:PfaB family protein
MDPLFQLLLHAGSRAFSDAQTEQLNMGRIGVIIGNLALPSEKSAALTRQWLGRSFSEKLLGKSQPSSNISPINRYVAGLPAGLLAHSLGLGGGSFTLDAACASSLYAIKLAMDELLSGRADAMLSGGVSRPDPLYTQMGFSQLRALSRRGICSPFDAAGDGLVVGEGAGIFLLKRTEDAIAHGDRIYGIIRGVGLSNDIGGSLLAPMTEGQLRAMRAAYNGSGWNPEAVDLIECHATGTQVGDATEFASLAELWGKARGPAGGCVIGSVKSNIGHLLTAAGAAALTKVIFSMAEGVLPPTANFQNPQQGVLLDGSPFRILKNAEPWERRGDGVPRRAAVSAFGFGGINAHLLVEEFLPKKPPRPVRSLASRKTPPSPIAVVGMDARFGPWQSLQAFRERVLGNDVSIEPTLPQHWWGADETEWFRKEITPHAPFKGYYIKECAVDTEQFRIPPKEMEEMLPQQLLMLQSAAAAMTDAGAGRADNLRTGVFVGIALDLNSTNFSFRWSVEEESAAWLKELGRELPQPEQAKWISELRDAVTPPLTANRTMGALGSIVASRIAREFKVGGPSFTISNEDGSGIRALETAVRLLANGEIDRALVGAVDIAGDLRAVLGHHAYRPFSPSGEALPFDERGDGHVVGEGAAAVVLKRLDDAKRDGDRIYAVIKGIGTAGGELLNPGAEPYLQALERAYGDAGVAPETVGYLEANAGCLVAEDRSEADILGSFFASGQRSCALSTIKPDIGHCGAASGFAGFIRGCLALYHEIIPPCRSGEQPIPELTGTGPLYLPRTPRYWLRNRAEGARRAGISVSGVDGTCSHVVLEGWEDETSRNAAEGYPIVTMAMESLFAVTGREPADLVSLLELLRRQAQDRGADMATLARGWQHQVPASAEKPFAMAIVARNHEELIALIDHGLKILASDKVDTPQEHPSLRDRLFYSTSPLGQKGKIAFVFPGSGNHFPGMGLELSARWPAIFRRQDAENLYLRSQFRPELFWNGASQAELHDDHQAVIFGQVATGCAVSDIVRSFGVQPQEVIGYSLGESAGLFALGAWHERDEMLRRMHESTLFTEELAGPCNAARRTWGVSATSTVNWSIGVLEAPAEAVRKALRNLPRVYLLIVNTPDECVIGGEASGIDRLVNKLGCRFFPLHGVTTVHCEVAKAVAEPYRQLHLFDTTPPPGIVFYSGAKGEAYPVDRESAADSILNQALHGIDFPAVVNNAYASGVRLFLEMGPGSSCSRMISRILAGRPHLARSACYPGVEQNSALLRLLAQLVAERVAVDLEQLYPPEPPVRSKSALRNPLQIRIGGAPFDPPPPPRPKTVPMAPVGKRDATGFGVELPPVTPATTSCSGGGADSFASIIEEFSAAQSARLQAHEAYLKTSEALSRSMADAVALEISLQERLAAAGMAIPTDIPLEKPSAERAAPLFDRGACLEFARGSVERMLGPAFREADTFPTRVRLPDEPLMLVDRITTLEGEARSMKSGRVVTEHDILPNAWYLDGGRIPTCIAVEAGQADLFLSGYLGIDFITRGEAVYRLLDAVVTFHQELPGPGETINYDIHIDRFFCQGETYLFRFRFEATVNNEPLLTMRDGCAGFFTAAELEAGKGIVRPPVDLRPRDGKRPADWQELVPMGMESYSADQLESLRNGDLEGCFGRQFAGLPIKHPLTIPGGLMRMVHRVTSLDPNGGRYGLGSIRAEADIRPDDWFITCHFVDDRVMPGTLMYECCMHTLRIFLLRMGWVTEASGGAWQPVPGVASQLVCRGQVLETTRVAAYEVSIRELGYMPEPYAVVDALMYADGKPIVEIVNMSVRLTGTTKQELENLWQKKSVTLPLSPSHQGRGNNSDPYPLGGEGGTRKSAIYTKEQILAYSNGNPSEGFGEPYRIFDKERKIARLPGPPFQFMDRVTKVEGEPWRMVAGAMAEAEYDIPPDAWYFAAERQQRMPFSILLEAALQPCGWLAAYVGSALTSPIDLSFRNLGGNAIQYRPLTPASGTITSTANLKKVSTSGGMIIQEFDLLVADRNGPIYEGETMFGFFSKEALANQVGIRDATPHIPAEAEITRGKSLPYPETAPFPEKQLRMIDRIDIFVPDGGPASLGYICGTKDVVPEEWFFKAHFYQDPVTPGSLGLESFLQLLKFVAVERWGWKPGDAIASIALGQRHRWLYRGQVIPANSRVKVEAWVTALDDPARLLTANGLLSVDGRPIYQMNDFTVQLEQER